MSTGLLLRVCVSARERRVNESAHLRMNASVFIKSESLFSAGRLLVLTPPAALFFEDTFM